MNGRRRTRRARPSARLTIIGVLAIAIVAVVGWIAYRANFGLPWQSRYELNVRVPDADRLIDGADVRVGGVRVGEVLAINAQPGPRGTEPYATLKLALSGSVGPLPANSTVQVRPASVLGLTYVDLHPGNSRRTIAAGGTLPLSAAKPASDLTDLFNIFDHSSAASFQQSLSGLAYGVAGRGTAINASIASLDQLLPNLTSVASELAAPSTQLADTLGAYEQLVAAVAPVSVPLAAATDYAATTFTALDSVGQALGAAIDAAPGAESATTVAFTRAAPALDNLGRLVVALRQGGALLPGAVADLNATLSAGIEPLNQVPAFSAPLHRALAALDSLASDHAANRSLAKLSTLATATDGVLSALTPAQVDCNVLGTWSQYFGSMWGGLGDGQGPALANLLVTSDGAEGEELQNARPSPNVAINPLPIEDQQQCQSGNEPFTGHQQLNNPSGVLSRSTRTTVPPPGVTALARKAGLLKPITGTG
jgi:virulence factor Mce-like protein